jgi:hypothetical protein
MLARIKELYRKKKIMMMFFTFVGVLVLLFLLVQIYYYLYRNTDIFKTEPQAARTCTDGTVIPCDRSSNCKWSSMQDYCYPEKISPTMILCAPAVKCGPNDLCYDFCHP